MLNFNTYITPRQQDASDWQKMIAIRPFNISSNRYTNSTVDTMEMQPSHDEFRKALSYE